MNSGRSCSPAATARRRLRIAPLRLADVRQPERGQLLAAQDKKANQCRRHSSRGQADRQAHGPMALPVPDQRTKRSECNRAHHDNEQQNSEVQAAEVHRPIVFEAPLLATVMSHARGDVPGFGRRPPSVRRSPAQSRRERDGVHVGGWVQVLLLMNTFSRGMAASWSSFRPRLVLSTSSG